MTKNNKNNKKQAVNGQKKVASAGRPINIVTNKATSMPPSILTPTATPPAYPCVNINHNNNNNNNNKANNNSNNKNNSNTNKSWGK